MNRRRLALSAFVVGSIAGPTCLHRWNDWRAVYPAFYQAGATHYIIHRGAPDIAMDRPIKDNEPTQADIDDAVDVSHLPVFSRAGADEPNPSFPSSFRDYALGFLASGRALLPWLRAVALGGLLSAIAGYFLPTICRFIFVWVPRLAVSYVRRLNGPQA